MRYLVFDNMAECSDAEVARMLAWEPAFRCRQALKFKHLFGQYACLKAYELLWLLLQEEGIDEPPTFLVDSNGKPTLAHHSEIFFSISHCKEAIAAVVSPIPVGIDVESFRTYSEALLKRTMSDDECRQIHASERPEEAFIRLWTQKEAVLKMRGTGIIDNLYDVLGGAEHIDTWTHPTKPYACSIATQNQ